ncbi:Na(+)/H(+) antiporter subunit F1 [Desulfuribacillus alkaliarsenatis]|uniref:Na(+)/H(+) antiporter subunit F n=1 Tax=Desulfuribacillus alkaliarsenatis TaxID=766136 RepID=A0A1E5G0H5_9FIRM|nr:Na(+)/H(+) antiporter subunit F1 [Desulfuribacillus alkaliarsenatis]OEF96322.1 Na(+)/H(+) antiporter subunit F [Desulfuribacillus alkaliarsenatis]
MLEAALSIALFLLAISIVLCLYRVIKGNSMSDRIVALDTIGLNLIGFTGINMIRQGTLAYVEVGLVIAILAFIGSIALAKYVEGGTVID